MLHSTLLPLPEVMLEMIFWNGITDGQQFHSQKDEINIG